MSNFLRVFKGLLIDDNEVKRVSRFACVGEMADGTKVFHEVDDNGEEVGGAWYSFSKTRIDGKVYNLFFLEAIN